MALLARSIARSAPLLSRSLAEAPYKKGGFLSSILSKFTKPKKEDEVQQTAAAAPSATQTAPAVKKPFIRPRTKKRCDLNHRLRLILTDFPALCSRRYPSRAMFQATSLML